MQPAAPTLTLRRTWRKGRPPQGHPEAAVLLVESAEALEPVLSAGQIATREAGCDGHTDTDPWRPHISIAYSNGSGPAGPVAEVQLSTG